MGSGAAITLQHVEGGNLSGPAHAVSHPVRFAMAYSARAFTGAARCFFQVSLRQGIFRMECFYGLARRACFVRSRWNRKGVETEIITFIAILLGTSMLLVRNGRDILLAECERVAIRHLPQRGTSRSGDLIEREN